MRIDRSSRFFQDLFKDGNDIAYYENRQPVTFTEIKEKKVDHQRLHLKRIRAPRYHISPCIIWVFRNPYFPFGGWWCYIKTTKRDFGINFRNPFEAADQRKLMEILPLGLLPGEDNFGFWMRAFEKKYHKDSLKTKYNAVKVMWCKFDWRGIVDVKLNRKLLLDD